MNAFIAAIRFLTIIPLPGARGTDERSLANSVAWFPLVGLLLGIVAAAVAWAMQLIAVPPMVAGAVLVIVLIAFSGGLHMDGLSDTADGFLSSRPRERVLEIMKDSHVGAMGVIAIVCVLMLKFAAIVSTPPNVQVAAMLLIPLAGRCAMVLPMALLDYVRPTGLGSVFAATRLRLAAGIALASLAGACIVVGLAVAHRLHEPGDAIIPHGLACVAWTGGSAVAAVALVLAMSAWSRRKIGGATGDVYGAACELAEVTTAVVLSMWR